MDGAPIAEINLSIRSHLRLMSDQRHREIGVGKAKGGDQPGRAGAHNQNPFGVSMTQDRFSRITANQLAAHIAMASYRALRAA